MADSPHARLERATAGLQAPFAVIDMDALWANAADMERRAAAKPIRLASKSLRCRSLQERVLARPGFRGTLAFTLPEALWLASHGADDLVVAYPTADTSALGELAQGEAPVTVMVDSVEQLDLIERAACGRGSEPIRVCIDLDVGWWLLGGRLRVGVKRSPVHTLEQAVALARVVLACERFKLVGLMAYEAQIAGLGDAPPGRPLRAAGSAPCRAAPPVSSAAGAAPSSRPWVRSPRKPAPPSSSSTAVARGASSSPPPTPQSPS